MIDRRVEAEVDARPEVVDGPEPAEVAPADEIVAGSARPFVITFLAGVGALVAAIIARDGWSFVYPLDDPLIHLTLARNLAEHHTFGINVGTYAPASSSPLWTILLTIPVAIVGPWRYLPLLMNVVAGVFVCRELARWVPAEVERRRRAVVAGSVVVAVGLAPLAVIGMEHVLHVLLVLVALRWIEEARRSPLTTRRIALLGLLFGAGCLVRFEFLFLTAGTTAALLFWSADRTVGLRAAIAEPSLLGARVREAAGVVLGSVAGLAAFAVPSLALGAHALPNSVIAKSDTTSGPLGFLRTAEGWRDLFRRMTEDATLVGVVGLVALLLVLSMHDRRRRWSGTAVAFLITAGLHVLLAAVGPAEPVWARYDTYLVVAGAALAFAMARDLTPAAWRRRVTMAMTVALLVIGSSRAILFFRVAAGSHAVARQQVQTAKFLDRYYDDDVVVLNDIGEVGITHQGGMVDLVGLADTEVLDTWKGGRFDADFVADLAKRRHAEVAALYPGWFGGQIPQTWITAGQWCLDEAKPMSVAERCVTWYATSPAAARTLRENLREFEPELPAGVSAKHS